MRPTLVATTLVTLLAAPRGLAEHPAPSTIFDLGGWKLQLPGPKEVKHLKGYSSGYFQLNARKELCFRLDAGERGTTPNTRFVRAELRHLTNWPVGQTHSLSAEVSVVSRLRPDKVTVLQIHGTTARGGNAPPLLRVAVNSGDLVAVIKTTRRGDKNGTVVLKKGLGSGWVALDVSVKARRLRIAVDGKTRVDRDLRFWGFDNYFKAGCYPQATTGTAEVRFRKLTAK
jgi:hypothetical protein